MLLGLNTHPPSGYNCVTYCIWWFRLSHYDNNEKWFNNWSFCL